jgi:hypothetical protein
MDYSIPVRTVYSTDKDDQGIVPWAIQRGLNQIPPGPPLPEDGDYGAATKAAVRAFQRKADLLDDGVFGPASSGALARRIQRKVDDGLPNRLLRSVVEGESNGLIGAVNWSVAGGVDCGYTQRRVKAAQYGEWEAVKRAFDPRYQFALLRTTLISRYATFLDREGVAGDNELAWRLAVLNHNYPYAADMISRLGTDGLSTYWRTPQQWVLNTGARFDDGSFVETPLNWCRFYSLGASKRNHKGNMVRLVDDWTV